MDRGFRFEQLEGRRLLAADCCLQGLPEMEVAPCEVASLECGVDDSMNGVESDIAETDIGDSTPTDDNASVSADTNSEIENVSVEPNVDDGATMLDLSDGMDGYFGALNAENPSAALTFMAPADGQIEVVIVSSFGNSRTAVAINDSAGNVIQGQSVELDGFTMLSFDASEGESYQLSISADDANGSGHFQVTVGFEAFVDQHADSIGSESTELVLVDGKAELDGRLETAGDTDTFRFTASSTGEMKLHMQETVDRQRVGLGVNVQDSEGNLLADGSTNELVNISFDVEQGKVYFVSIAATHAQKGTYQFGLELEPSTTMIASETEAPAEDSGQVCDEIVNSDNEEPVNDVVDEIADDVVGDVVDDVVDNVVEDVVSEVVDDECNEVVDEIDDGEVVGENENEIVDIETPVVVPPQDIAAGEEHELNNNECELLAGETAEGGTETGDQAPELNVDQDQPVDSGLAQNEDEIAAEIDSTETDLSGVIGGDSTDSNVDEAEQELTCGVVPEAASENGNLSSNPIDTSLDVGIDVGIDEGRVKDATEQAAVDEVFAGLNDRLDIDLTGHHHHHARRWFPWHRGFQRS